MNGCGANSGLLQGVNLVLHEGDQRRDHQGGASSEESGKLKAKRLAGARGHDHKGVLAAGYMGADRPLPGPEARVGEAILQQGVEIHGAPQLAGTVYQDRPKLMSEIGQEMSASATVQVIRHPGGMSAPDRVAVEEPLEIRIEGRALAVTMRTPGHDQELVAGFLYTEGCIDGPDDLSVLAHVRDPQDPQDNTVDVRLAAGVKVEDGRFASAQREFYASSSCGVCGKATIERVMLGAPALKTPLRVPLEALVDLPERMRASQSAFEKTGGLHAAALFSAAGEIQVLREDVGRHNAVDKVLGFRLLQDEVPVDDAVLVVSGRAGFEIVQKALVARVPVVAAVGAPSSLAVSLAQESGIQLVGFLRDGRCNQYAPVLP